MKSRKKRLSQIVVALLIVYTIGLPIQNIVLANTNEQAINEAVVTEEIEAGADEVETSSSEEAEKPTVESVPEEEKTSEKAATSAITEIAPSEQLMEAIIDSEVESKGTNQPVEAEKDMEKDVKAVLPDKISVIFPDAALAEVIRVRLGKASVDDVVTQAELDTISQIAVSGIGIADLTGFEHLRYLRGTLLLQDNEITDISPLMNLPNARINAVVLFRNKISDLSPLENANLPGVESFYFDDNQISDLSPLGNLGNANLYSSFKLSFNGNSNISDLSPLANMSNLTALGVQNTKVSDISPLKNLNLVELNIGATKVSDLSPLANMLDMEKLTMYGLGISDISPLENMTKMTHLYMDGNPSGDLSLVANMTDIEQLEAAACEISDVSPLANLTKLEWLVLTYNHISDISPLANLHNTSAGGDFNIGYQTIELPAVKWSSSSFDVTNMIKRQNGTLVVPNNITGGGSYAAPTITWANVANANQTLTYTGDGSNISNGNIWYFSATVTIPVKRSGQYDVHFDVDGTVTTESVEVDELIPSPNDPQKTGYTFTGWYDAQSGGNQWDFTTNTMPANEITLYAQFSKALIPMPNNAYINFYEDSTLKYAIPYDGLDQWDGINGVWTNGLVTATPPANNPNKTGHTFTGWEDEQGDLFDFSTTQLDLNSQNEFNFYAAFEKKEYTVTFVIDGKKETQKVLFEELIEEPMSPEKEGHTFDGWHTSPQTRATQWDFNTMGMPANDLTLHAKFTKLSDSGSGSGSGGSEKPSKPVPPVTPEQPGDKDSTNDFKDETTASDTGSMTVTSQENTETSSPEASQQSKLAQLGEQNSMILQGFGLLMVISGIAFFWWKRRKKVHS
ncbi:InlB B-repeat-containing protein [Listeria monocytogenes]|nr:LPXTG cell wall anchor domain-containing protein [Listeria monocytogenes]EHE1139510.1 LPXTG cell wall anchor domain-containing protein [Listeria monocytogenes]EHO7443016.1 InlB B-repeat-containing protein [Listeria monocytogenes]EHO9271266.1 InlB B-repeat-containing protein [Listeria monocytogenes]EHQ4556239.1 InlB B-repeat-containing protein [Listeria monocytogenes]